MHHMARRGLSSKKIYNNKIKELSILCAFLPFCNFMDRFGATFTTLPMKKFMYRYPLETCYEVKHINVHGFFWRHFRQQITENVTETVFMDSFFFKSKNNAAKLFLLGKVNERCIQVEPLRKTTKNICYMLSGSTIFMSDQPKSNNTFS